MGLGRGAIMSVAVIVVIILIGFVFIILILPVLPGLIRRVMHPPDQDSRSPEKNTDAISKQYFLSGAEHAKHNYRVVSGNLYPGVFDQDTATELANILTRNPKLEVRLFVGSEIQCVKEKGDNPIWQLYESQKFNKQLQIRVLAGYPEQHYRVVDSKELYLEEPHDRRSTIREFQIKGSSCTNAILYASEFDKAWGKADPQRLPEFELVPATSR